MKGGFKAELATKKVVHLKASVLMRLFRGILLPLQEVNLMMRKKVRSLKRNKQERPNRQYRV